MSSIGLKIQGKEWEKWEEVSIVRSVDSMAGAFKFKFSDIFKDGLKKSFAFGDEVIVTINDVAVITGYLEEISLDNKGQEQILVIGGRDKTGVLVDCSFVGTSTEWKKQKVSSIISQLCTAFGIGITIDSSATSNTGNIIETFKATEGDSIKDMISQLCVDSALMPISLGDGRLTLTQVTESRKMKDGIQLPGNAQAGLFLGDDTDRYSQYIVKGIGIGTADKDLVSFIQPHGSSDDSILKNYRPNVIFSETPANMDKCKNRAEWENRYRAGMSRQYIYTMTEWSQSNKKPWDIHSLVAVKDDVVNLATDLYIREIEYSRIGDKETCELNCVQPSTYTQSGKLVKSEYDS